MSSHQHGIVWKGVKEIPPPNSYRYFEFSIKLFYLFSILTVRNNQCGSSDFRPIDHLIKSNHDPLWSVVYPTYDIWWSRWWAHHAGFIYVWQVLYIIANVIFEHPVALYSSDYLSFCAVCVQRRSLFFIGHYMFQPNWQSSGILVVMVKDSAAL
jgi:hypothetical protein